MMKVVSITTELNKCLRFSKNEDDLISCLVYAIEKSQKNENNKITILPQEDVIILKKMILRLINEKELNLSYIFKKLWWNKNREINVIAAYFVPEVFNNPNQIDWILFRQVFDRLKSWDITTIVSIVMTELIEKKIEYWKLYLSEIIKLNNKWALRLVALIIGNMTIKHKELVPELLNMLMLIIRTKDWEVQQAVSWCLNNMAGMWTNPATKYKNLWDNNISSKIILN